MKIMTTDKIIQIATSAYVNIDGESITYVYGLSESGTLYSWRYGGWKEEEKSPSVK